MFPKNLQYYKFCSYGFLKNLRFFDAFFLLFLLEKGLSYTQIGILYAVREIVINLVEIPSGIFADTYGRKSTLAGSFVFYIFSFLLFYTSNSFVLFLLAFTIYGIADAFRSGTHKGMIMDYLKLNGLNDYKINYYGHTRSCSQKGSALSALIAGFIVLYYGNYQRVFLLSTIPYVINFLLILSYPKELNNLSINKKKSHKPSLRNTLLFFLHNIKNSKVLSIVNTTALHSAFQKAGKDYIQPVMLQVALLIPLLSNLNPEKKNGLFIGIFYFLIFLLTAQASKYAWLFNKKTKRNTAYITILYGFGFGVLAGLFYLVDWWLLALLAFTGIYIIENIRKPVLTGILADHVPNEILTSVISLESLWKTIISIAFSLLLGILADTWNIGWAFLSLSAIILSITVLFNLLVKYRK